MIFENTVCWHFNVISNFSLYMFLAFMFTYFIIRIIEKISKKENKFKQILKEITIMDFVFWGSTIFLKSKELSYRMYLILSVGLIIVYILGYLIYYVINEKRIKEIKKK